MELKQIVIFLFLLSLCQHNAIYAQEGKEILLHNGNVFIDARLHHLERFDQRSAKATKKLLGRLDRKEKRFAKQLQKKDTAAYEKYRQQSATVSYDSLNKLNNQKNRPSIVITRRPDKLLDSLQRIHSFVSAQTGVGNGALSPADKYTQRIKEATERNNYRQYINEQIQNRKNFLKNSIAGSSAGYLKGIDKDLFYSKEKLGNLKQMIDEPSSAEEQALEYLQGTEGFDKAVSPGSAMSGTEVGDLEKMGYQTKSLLQKSMNDKFGANLANVQKNMGEAVGKWQDQFASVKQNKDQVMQAVAQAKAAKAQAFKVNPMRCLPFSQRLVRQFNIQPSRALGNKPALLEGSAMLGFRQTEHLSYGLGLAGDLGLGRNWSTIRLSFEGIGFRTYAQWDWKYGLGAYMGYERLYKKTGFLKNNEVPGQLTYTTHNTDAYSESFLFGIVKQYKISQQWNGSVQLLADIWWQEKGMASPFVFRINTMKK